MASETAAPAKGGTRNMLVLGLVALVAAGAGAAVPWVLLAPKDSHKKVEPQKAPPKPVIVPFGEVVVNLGEERLTRYLRVKVVLVVEEAQNKEVSEQILKEKAFLKNWLIGYLSDQSIQEVSRAAGVNRVRREIRDQFNAMLFPDGAERIQDVLFDEFVVQ